MKNVTIMSIQELDKLVQKTYGKIYSYQQQDDCKDRGVDYITVPCHPEDYENETLPEIINGDEMGVSFKTWLARDSKAPLNPTKEELAECPYYYSGVDLKKWCKDKSNIGMFWERNFYPHISMIVNDLHSKGLLKAGEYGINIDW